MSNLDDIEKAIAKLGTTELEKFRAWFETFEAEQFDRKIERDAWPASSIGSPKRRLRNTPRTAPVIAAVGRIERSEIRGWCVTE